MNGRNYNNLSECSLLVCSTPLYFVKCVYCHNVKLLHSKYTIKKSNILSFHSYFESNMAMAPINKCVLNLPGEIKTKINVLIKYPW